MNGVFTAAADIQGICRERSWSFCFIGGLAVQRWGEPRQTRDVDLTLLTGFGGEQAYVGELLDLYGSRIDDARAFALAHRVLLPLGSGGVGLDIALGALPFEERAVARASDWRIDDRLALHTCCAEDLIVYKAFAGPAQDWSDIEMIVARQGSGLDRRLVLDEAETLLALKDVPDDARRLRDLLGGSRPR